MTRATFAMPALLALGTAIGLVAALTGDGVRDAIGWAGLGAPLAAILWAWRGRARRR